MDWSTTTGTAVKARAATVPHSATEPHRTLANPPASGIRAGTATMPRYRGFQELTNWATHHAKTSVRRAMAAVRAIGDQARPAPPATGVPRRRPKTATAMARSTTAHAAEAKALNESPKKSSTDGCGAQGAPVL